MKIKCFWSNTDEKNEFMNRILEKLKRKYHKRESIINVLKSEQYNNDVVNVHRYDLTNAGDFYCAPHHYFDELKGKYLDIFDYKSDEIEVRKNWIEQISNNALIIGGGGLLNHHAFNKQMRLFEKLNIKGKKTVVWGIGHNKNRWPDFEKYNVNPSKFGLFGTRDYSVANEWLPCVSCLHPMFDKKYIIENEIGVVFHKKNINKLEVISKFNKFPSIYNSSNFEEIIKFIGSCDTLLTDSYHGMYWGLLLNKKVLHFSESSKFHDYKYPITSASIYNYKAKISSLKPLEGVLEEAREINNNFAQKAFDYLEIT